MGFCDSLVEVVFSEGGGVFHHSHGDDHLNEEDDDGEVAEGVVGAGGEVHEEPDDDCGYCHSQF